MPWAREYLICIRMFHLAAVCGVGVEIRAIQPQNFSQLKSCGRLPAMKTALHAVYAVYAVRVFYAVRAIYICTHKLLLLHVVLVPQSALCSCGTSAHLKPCAVSSHLAAVKTVLHAMHAVHAVHALYAVYAVQSIHTCTIDC